MASNEENILHSAPIPKYLLDSKSNLSQYFIRLLGEKGNATAMVCLISNLNNAYNWTFMQKYNETNIQI